MHSQQNRTRWGRRIAVQLGVIAVSVGLAFASAVPAHAVDESLTIDSLTSGPVEVLTDTAGDYFAPGTAYFEVTFKLGKSDDYIASWERSKGSWAFPSDAVSAMLKFRECTRGEYTQMFSAGGYSGFTEFQATHPSPEGGEWAWAPTTEEQNKVRKTCQSRTEFDWTGSTSDWDSATRTVTAQIPLSQVGPGTHKIFVIPYNYHTLGPNDESIDECTLVDFPDGTFIYSPCIPGAVGVTAMTTVVVPDTKATPSPTASSNPNPSESPTAVPVAGHPSPAAQVPWLPLGIGAGLIVIIAATVGVVLVARSGNGPRPQG